MGRCCARRWGSSRGGSWVGRVWRLWKSGEGKLDARARVSKRGQLLERSMAWKTWILRTGILVAKFFESKT
jgi:hypothetical protein